MTAPAGALKTRPGIKPLAKRWAWRTLQIHYQDVQKLHLRDLSADPSVGKRW
jgi:hypothetical protein